MIFIWFQHYFSGYVTILLYYPFDSELVDIKNYSMNSFVVVLFAYAKCTNAIYLMVTLWYENGEVMIIKW